VTFLVIALNTHAKTAKLITPTLQPCHAQQKFLQKLTFSSAWGCIYNLQITPTIFFSPRGARAPTAPPGYVYAYGTLLTLVLSSRSVLLLLVNNYVVCSINNYVVCMYILLFDITTCLPTMLTYRFY